MNATRSISNRSGLQSNIHYKKDWNRDEVGINENAEGHLQSNIHYKKDWNIPLFYGASSPSGLTKQHPL